MAKRARLSERQTIALMTINHSGLGWVERPQGVALTTLGVLVSHGLIEQTFRDGKRMFKITPEGEDWAHKFMQKITRPPAGKQEGNAPETVSERVSGRIRTLRLVAGMSQELLSKRVGSSRATVNAVETHISQPSLRLVERAGSIFGVEPYLFLAPDAMWQEFIKERL